MTPQQLARIATLAAAIAELEKHLAQLKALAKAGDR